MSWRCKKCGSKDNITVIETINYHNCKLDKYEEVINCIDVIGVRTATMNLESWENWQNGRKKNEEKESIIRNWNGSIIGNW